VVLSSKLRRRAVIDLPAPRGRLAGAVPSYFDPVRHAWVAAERFRRTATGFRLETDHFTLFAVPQFLGLRAKRPKCDPEARSALRYVLDPVPRRFGGEDNRLLFACAERTSAGGPLRLRLVNNRSYLMAVKLPDGVQAGAPVSADLPGAVAQGLAEIADTVLPGNTVLVPAGAQVVASVPVGAAKFLVEPQPSQAVAAIGLGVDAVAELGGGVKAFVAAAKCIYRKAAADAGANFGLSDVVDTVEGCVLPLAAGGNTSLLKRGATFTRLVLKRLLVARAVAEVADAAFDEPGALLWRIGITPPDEPKPQPPAVADWQLSAVGIGPLRVGMSEEEARAVGVDLQVDRSGMFCDSWSVPGLNGVVMFATRDDEGLRVIQVIDGGTRHGFAGVGLGDSLATLRSKVGAQLEAVEAGPGLGRSFYRVYSPDRATAVQFSIDDSDDTVTVEEAGAPEDFYYPAGTELCA
jgi:hypothetical protein